MGKFIFMGVKRGPKASFNFYDMHFLSPVLENCCEPVQNLRLFVRIWNI